MAALLLWISVILTMYGFGYGPIFNEEALYNPRIFTASSLAAATGMAGLIILCVLKLNGVL